MKKGTLLLIAAAVVGLVAWRQSQAATSSSSAGPAGAVPAGDIPFGISDAVFPGIVGDPYLAAAAGAQAAGAPSSSILGGKLDWGFLTAVANSNALNRRGGTTADKLLDDLFSSSPGAPGAAAGGSSGGGFTGGGGGGGGGQKGGGQVRVF